ncbi:ArgE/DapE family deacylase [Acidisphaera sp. L21]|uniref:ArgE/DapE family deacylase n=1 Tax=Acidisphaera sp. L21 TaxID=1641851 RepID=UPI00131C1965|nr:ArgE/DapE family deacylase [Acidisphaera sp. L21]
MPQPSLDPALRGAILAAIDAQAGEGVTLLEGLVRHRSLLGEEHGAIDAMAAAYEGLGLAPRKVPLDVDALAKVPGFSPPLISYAGRDNVVAIHRPVNATGRSLMLQGHVDVVPEGAADLWTTPPFQPSIRDGRMYGRGAGDMKAGLASIVMAVRALHAAGVQPAAELQLAAVIEEECTGNGALAVMHALPMPDACLIPEPGPGFAAIYVAEVGVIWAWVTVTGRPVHVREAHAGVSAIQAAAIVAEAFGRYEDEANRAERRHPAFAGDNHPINVNIGTIEGGEWNSSVATRAKLGIRVGVMPGQSCFAVKAEIEALVAKTAHDERLRGAMLSVEFKGFMADGCVFPADQPIAQLVSAQHEAVAGEPVRHYCAAGLTDARHYVLAGGTQATCYGPDAQNIHGIDESVGLDCIIQTTKVIALTIAEWCGLEHRPSR